MAYGKRFGIRYGPRDQIQFWRLPKHIIFVPNHTGYHETPLIRHLSLANWLIKVITITLQLLPALHITYGYKYMRKIRQVLAQEDTVLFIGSGISMWSGLPSWAGVIEELAVFAESSGANADLIRSEAAKGELLQAASYGFDKLTKHQIGEFIKCACRFGHAEPHEIHRKIVTLGPRCFITTNYDNLLEESLRKWQKDLFFRPPVTNRHLTETAEIVQARACDFIFKPHGDAADSDSIILTREQYRQLLPGGERQAALESLKMILASRPVVYLGFGLRDPDFIYLRDILANTYKGGTRDHFAVMADVTEAEGDYWRRNYGIHLVGYATTERPDKKRDHTPLLALLDTLLEKPPTLPVISKFDPSSPDVIFSLARYSAGLERFQKLASEFKLRVHARDKKTRGSTSFFRSDKFDHCLVEQFLDSGPTRAVLIGLPGAGKSYALRRSSARLAEALREACLLDTPNEKAFVVPIFADLKLYKGDIAELINGTLPKSLPLRDLTQHFKVKIFLDSFNEMPREYWESGRYEADCTKFITEFGSASLVIGSRTSDGLAKFELPEYYLDEIDAGTLTTELQRLKIEVEGRFDREVRSLLQRPFYFQYVASGAVTLPPNPHPRDFYQFLFAGLRKSFETHFAIQIDIERALSLTAYDSLNRGEEAFQLVELFRVLRTSIEAEGVTDIDVQDVANWLVSTLILIPQTGGRCAFVHQTVTEYLAAKELARLYQLSPHLLREKLSLTRWDQALFLTLSLLPPDQADIFLQDVIKADFALALNAAKYLEVGRDEVLSKLLSEVPVHCGRSDSLDHKIEFSVAFDLPLTDAHEPQLRALISLGGIIGGSAISRLVSMNGAAVKDEFLGMLVEHADDYNFCANGLARALRPFVTEDDASKIAHWADTIQIAVTPDTDPHTWQGFASGAATFLKKLDLDVIRRELLPADSSLAIPAIRAEILCGIVREHRSTVGLNFAGDLLLRGAPLAAYCIYAISEYSEPDCALSWACFTAEHVTRLLQILHNDEDWGLDALRNVCMARSDLAEIVKQASGEKVGIEKLALLYCVDPANLTPLFQALEELAAMNRECRQGQRLHLLKHIKLDWTGKEKLFSQLLMLRDKRLTGALIGPGIPSSIKGLGNLALGSIHGYLEWMMELVEKDNDYWFLNRLGSFFSQHLSRDTQQEFVAEFNRVGSKFRLTLLQYVLPYFNDTTTDAFGEDAISFLLADLNQGKSGYSFNPPLLGSTATERFAHERLLPLLSSAREPLLKNLQKVLKEAGSRHGKRYLLD